MTITSNIFSHFVYFLPLYMHCGECAFDSECCQIVADLRSVLYLNASSCVDTGRTEAAAATLLTSTWVMETLC